MFILFGIFILSCGATHVMAIVTLWKPVYRLDGLIKAVTAIASLPTALLLWRLVPQAAAIPSLSQWRRANEELQTEIQERKRAEHQIWILNADLERRVEERTRELAEKNIELEHLTTALRRTNAELEQFAYAAAHDLQEPLRNVSLGTQAIASRCRGLDSETEQFLRFTVAGAQRMEIMIKDLLLYCRALNGPVKVGQAVPSDTVLETALRNLQRTMEETQAEITWDELPAVFVQEIHLLQIFQNLVSNALKYRGEDPPRVHISATQHDRQWVFSVADNGIGIPSQFQERIFGVFKRLGQRDVPGSGIGLALCKRIVEHYGGRIWVDSEVNRGATFSFTVPLEGNKAHEFQYA